MTFPIINIDGKPYAIVSINVIGPGGKPRKLKPETVKRISKAVALYEVRKRPRLGHALKSKPIGSVSFMKRKSNVIDGEVTLLHVPGSHGAGKAFTLHGTRTGRWDASKPNLSFPEAQSASSKTKKAVSMPAKSTLNPHQKIAAKLSPGAKAVLKAATATSTIRADLQKNSGVEGRQFAPALRRLVNTGCLTASGEGEKAKFKRSATGNKVFGTLPA